MSQPIIRQSGKLKDIVGIGQPAIKEAFPKKCYNCKKLLIVKSRYLRNSIVVVVVNMFIFVGENARLGPGHTTKLHVHL